VGRLSTFVRRSRAPEQYVVGKRIIVTNVASCYSKIFVTKQQNKLPNLNKMQRSASNLKVRFIKRDIHILIVSKRLKILKATSNNG
jgi:hypothetical protein